MAKLQDILGADLFKQLPEDKQKEYKDKDLEDVSNGAYIPKVRFDQINEQVKEYKKQVGERDTQLSKLKDEYKDVEGLKTKVTQLEADNAKQKTDYEAKLNQITLDNAVEAALSAYKVKDAKLIKGLLQYDKLKVDGDSVIGLKEQMEEIKKNYEYLFEKDVNSGKFNTGGVSGGKDDPQSENFATQMGKAKAEQMKSKGLEDFIK